MSSSCTHRFGEGRCIFKGFAQAPRVGTKGPRIRRIDSNDRLWISTSENASYSSDGYHRVFVSHLMHGYVLGMTFTLTWRERLQLGRVVGAANSDSARISLFGGTKGELAQKLDRSWRRFEPAFRLRTTVKEKMIQLPYIYWLVYLCYYYISFIFTVFLLIFFLIIH